MSMKSIRKLLEKLDDAVYDAEVDLDAAYDESKHYCALLEEKEEEVFLMREEIKLRCRIIYECRVKIPVEGHYMDINPLVAKEDPHKGQYDYEYSN